MSPSVCLYVGLSVDLTKEGPPPRVSSRLVSRNPPSHTLPQGIDWKEFLEKLKKNHQWHVEVY